MRSVRAQSTATSGVWSYPAAGDADALAMYSNATSDSDKPIKELEEEEIPAMRSAFEQLHGFFHGYDYSAAVESIASAF